MALFGVFVPLAPAQPSIGLAVNGASFQPVISGGSWVSILGANLSATTRSWRPDDVVDGVLPTRLDGVSVSINRRAAAVFFVSPTQINVLAPPDASTGPVPVTVTNAAGTSAAFLAEMQPFTPAFFLWDNRYAVATRRDFSRIGPPGLFEGVSTTPARPGETVILWGTGFGPTAPPAPAGRVVTGLHTIPTPPLVRIGGLAAEYLGGALAPGSAGLYQIAVRVPALAPAGDLAVTAEFPGAASPSNVFLTVQR